MAEIFNDENFEEKVIKSDKVVLVDFFAPWCGPCQMMGPIIDELAEEVSGNVVVGKLDVDENPESASKYGVMSIPTLKIFKGGEAVKEFTGVQSKEGLLEELKGI